MEIPFLTGLPGPQGRYPVNLFFVPETERGRPALLGTPGLKVFCDTGKYAEVRGLHTMGNGNLYTVVGNELFYITSGGAATSKGSVNTKSGPVWMVDNAVPQLMIVDGQNGYIFASGTLTEITDADFPSSPSSVNFQDQYFIVTAEGRPNFYISAENDGTSWSANDTTYAEGHPDELIAGIQSHREYWALGRYSSEGYENTGNVDFPFERLYGGFIEVGLGAAASLCRLNNTVFWLDENGLVRMAIGVNPQIVSTPEINRHIASYSKISDAIAFGYTYRGYPIYQITFPTVNKTWCYNCLTQFWHQMASGPRQPTGEFWRHRANCHAWAYGKNIVGDFENGILYELDGDTYLDDDEPIIRERCAPEVHADRKNIAFHNLEIEQKAGIGLVSGQGSDPQAMLDWSNDGGRTWSNEHWQSIGKIGEYTRRTIWRRLGAARNRTFRWRISDPVEVEIYGAYLNATKGIS